MLSNIDWISFSVLGKGADGFTVDRAGESIGHLLNVTLKGHQSVLHFEEEWILDKGRTPYSHSFRRHDNGVSIFFHPNLTHFLVEITGRGCERLATEPNATDFLNEVAHRITRLDIACDMLTDEKPTTFAENREIGRFKSHSSVISESGETYYVGSRTSNRYARVYRYNPPHERAHLLRCEYVVKAEDAKLVVEALLEEGMNSVVKKLGEQFGWKSQNWNPDEATESDLKAYRKERRNGKTIFWLADTVAPLVIRLHREGTIDAIEWFNNYVLSQIGGEDALLEWAKSIQSQPIDKP